jgi:hypothetical protein
MDDCESVAFAPCCLQHSRVDRNTIQRRMNTPEDQDALRIEAEGGHFAALEQPELFVAELRKSFDQVR